MLDRPSRLSNVLCLTARWQPIASNQGQCVAIFVLLLSDVFLPGVDWLLFQTYDTAGYRSSRSIRSSTWRTLSTPSTGTPRFCRHTHERIPPDDAFILSLRSRTPGRQSLLSTSSCTVVSGNGPRSDDVLHIPRARTLPFDDVEKQNYRTRLPCYTVRTHR